MNIFIEFLFILLMLSIIFKELRNNKASNKLILFLSSSSIFALLLSNILTFLK